jgi:AcrR family transcriptional regulator
LVAVELDTAGTTFALRTQRKLATRQALQEAALLLFAEQGYADTSSAQIAQLAGVSVRTFFVHFPTKEDVLFEDVDKSIDEWGELILAAPGELSDLSAIEYAAIEVSERVDQPARVLQHRIHRFRVQATDTSSVVRGVRARNAARFTATVAAAVGQRREENPISLATLTVSEIGCRAQFLALDEWAVALPDDLTAIVRKRFDAVREVARNPDRI